MQLFYTLLDTEVNKILTVAVNDNQRTLYVSHTFG